jgi:hypothetical protein
MTRLRSLDDFPTLWSRRTTLVSDDGGEINLMAVPDLVEAKKTQRDKDWPMISALVEEHYHSFGQEANAERIAFWLMESRIPERLTELALRFPSETADLIATRPLLALARDGNLPTLRAALDAETRAIQEIDRQYWEPLKREIEAFRREERMERG